MYYFDETWQNYYGNMSKQELLDSPPKGVAVRTPKRGVLEVEVPCFRLLPFLVVLVPVLFSFYLLYVGVMSWYTAENLGPKLFGTVFFLLAAWIWYTKPIEVLAYSGGD